MKETLSPGTQNPVHNLLLYYEREGQRYHGAVGTADGKVAVGEDFQFKIASVTKTFTATVILQLAEKGEIDLDGKAHDYLAAVPFINFDKLHNYQGGSYGKEITVRQLLTHTSGLADLFFDRWQAFYSYWQEDKQRSWNPELLFEFFYKEKLHDIAHFKPGEGFHYSDVNYFLLSLIIEKETGLQLGAAMRKYILTPLGMNDSYFEYEEEPIGNGNLAHAFMGTEDINVTANTSFDWGGGGLVSTTRDLAIFVKGLLSNKLFEKPETLAAMKAPLDTGMSSYGMGLVTQRVNGEIYYGHSGFWGVVMLYNPTTDETFCLTWNQVNVPFNYLKLSAELLQLANDKGH